MIRLLTAVSFIALLTACSAGNPLFDEDGNPTRSDQTDTTGGTAGDDADGDIDNDGATPPPGTEDPTLSGAIFRFEERDSEGGGLVTEVAYDRANDTFYVDNLAFDGANIYQRNSPVSTLRSYRVFAADEITDDFLTGDAIGQIVPYRAIYGVSRNRVNGDPRTSFAIVRTGGYVGHGFGGYVYERSTGTVLPQTGQATFSGDYGGVWTTSGVPLLGYVTGDMRMDIDFEDFNANAGIKGIVNNRLLLDESGSVLGTLPPVGWIIEEGVMTLDANGEILTDVFTIRSDPDTGARQEFMTGTFNGLISGDITAGNGGEIVGILEMDASANIDDGTGLSSLTGNLVPDNEGTSVGIKETGGAILYRN